MPEGLPAELEVQVPSALAFVRPVRKMLEGLLGAQGWQEDDVEDLGLLLTEVLQNAVEHGSQGDGTERITIICSLEPTTVTLDVSDPGTGKDPHVAVDRDVTVQPPLDGPRGRGLFIVHRMATSFDRRVTDKGGLRVVVRRAAGGS